MKMNLAAKLSLPVVLFLVIAFLTGCKTPPPVDWNSRVGNYTYDQAVAELGQPDRQAKLSDGKTVFKWIAQTHGSGNINVGMGYYGGNTGIGASQGGPDRVLQLTFDADGKLTAWSKNY